MGITVTNTLTNTTTGIGVSNSYGCFVTAPRVEKRVIKPTGEEKEPTVTYTLHANMNFYANGTDWWNSKAPYMNIAVNKVLTETENATGNPWTLAYNDVKAQLDVLGNTYTDTI